ncbi:hypothetical protein BGZ63DRAFT_395730 [Mariannaea sp. PMI_226]|nr:hypothetical protein BGZ63DRAFT_395730 [Mariannaea sp. PMI_226]
MLWRRWHEMRISFVSRSPSQCIQLMVTSSCSSKHVQASYQRVQVLTRHPCVGLFMLSPSGAYQR